MQIYTSQPTDNDGLHICPVCGKLFLEAKSMFRHIMRAHPDSQTLAMDLRVDMYRRWQDRNPRLSQ